jgi:hypothetical protein
MISVVELRDMKENLRTPLVWAIGSVAMLGLLIGVGLYILRPQPPIPDNIYKKLNFSLFYPDPASGYKINQAFVSYDSNAKVVIFHAKSGGRDMLISEQATPAVFNDIPDYYQKLIEKLNGYSSFDSINGTVSLTKPTELKGVQTAILNSKGILMFIRPNQTLSDDDWRKFFKDLIVAK